MIARDKPSETCLSRLQISRWALSDIDIDDAADFASHVASCARCANLVAAERASVERCAGLPLPAGFAKSSAGPAQQTRTWARGVAAMAALIAASIVAVFAVRQQDVGSNRSKGHGALTVAIRRDGAVSEHVLAANERFRPGDGVRLRVPAGTLAWVLVQKRGDSGWEQVYLGHPDHEGWLPLSFTISDAPAVPVRVLVCTDAPEGAAQDLIDTHACTVQETQF